ncbi:HAD-like domain-containing protein [Nemania sp. FL0916]|nr:HAD-like domain-containing protein [Nemania sp. FL0916]
MHARSSFASVRRLFLRSINSSIIGSHRDSVPLRLPLRLVQVQHRSITTPASHATESISPAPASAPASAPTGDRATSRIPIMSPASDAYADAPENDPLIFTKEVVAPRWGAKKERHRPKNKKKKTSKPSPESGGVPDPTPEYLERASHPPFILPQPRNLLVVVDLNGTLLHRPNHYAPTRFIERPYAKPFLAYCVKTFSVVVWSSARPRNVENMCNQLLTPADRAKVVTVWGRDTFGLTESDYNIRVQCYKRLSALWNNPVVAATHPQAAEGKTWSQVDTVLVDDSFEKARTEPFNLVPVPEFEGNNEEPGFVLPQVHDYLNTCSQQANVSAYMKSSPFKINPDFKL